ncbi:MAG: DUF58 domain-containing protein [Planctomycetes bacterium]|nr:DUF58 domain-containing protein [Planctomycetota bacterium]
MADDRANATELLVPELMARVSQIQLRTHRMVNAVLSGAYRSTFRGSGIEFDEVRPYQPGDDVRGIDWQRTAKSGEPYVKVYVEERELTLVFVVDTSLSMNFGSRLWTKREVAAAFCSLLSFVAQRSQDRVGLCMFGTTPGKHLPPRKGASAVARVVREVIAAPPTAGGTDFKAMLELQERAVRRRSLLFVVSDFEGFDDAAAEVLGRLARRHDVVAARVVDPFERELPAAGRIWMREIESGRLVEVDSRSSAVRSAWQSDFDARSAALAERTTKAGVDLIELGTGQNLSAAIADPLAKYFSLRRRRRAGPA